MIGMSVATGISTTRRRLTLPDLFIHAVMETAILKGVRVADIKRRLTPIKEPGIEKKMDLM